MNIKYLVEEGFVQINAVRLESNKKFHAEVLMPIDNEDLKHDYALSKLTRDIEVTIRDEKVELFNRKTYDYLLVNLREPSHRNKYCHTFKIVK